MDRKLKNRESAAKSRQKQSERFNELECAVNNLMEQNKCLMEAYQSMKQENERLRTIICAKATDEQSGLINPALEPPKMLFSSFGPAAARWFNLG